jgi:hypothetical protein
MDINILGYKFRVEILIIIVLVWWILCGHVICGCSNVTLPQAVEAFTSIAREGFNMVNAPTSISGPYRNRRGV